MSSLTPVEKRYFQDLLMSEGYVLDFTNATFSEFFRSTANIDIDDVKYTFNGNSKAKRTRAFWEIENDKVVGKVLSGMLDIWEYRNSGSRETRVTGKYRMCRKVVDRLLGKRSKRTDDITAHEFLKKDFGDISASKLRVDEHVLPIIESRLSEAIRCLGASSYLATIFLCGSILEGSLLGVALDNPQKFNQSPASPKSKEGKVKKFQDWSLSNFIDVACSVGFLKLDVKKFSHVLRDFRNYIHPYQQMASGFNPDDHTARICLQVLKAALSDLSGKR